MYYVMECYGTGVRTTISETPDLPGGPWMSGKPIAIDVPDPLVFVLDPERPGQLKAMYSNKIPVMRDDLVEAIQSAGVDNLELFPAVVRDTVNKVDHKDYKAFNVVGVIACADMDATEMMGISDSTMIDADIESLVVDESKTGGALLLRLAEAVNAIIVHESVMEAVEERGIEGMSFSEPEDWSG